MGHNTQQKDIVEYCKSMVNTEFYGEEKTEEGEKRLKRRKISYYDTKVGCEHKVSWALHKLAGTFVYGNFMHVNPVLMRILSMRDFLN